MFIKYQIDFDSTDILDRCKFAFELRNLSPETRKSILNQLKETEPERYARIVELLLPITIWFMCHADNDLLEKIVFSETVPPELELFVQNQHEATVTTWLDGKKKACLF